MFVRHTRPNGWELSMEPELVLDQAVVGVGTGTANGTFGELLQGVLPDNSHFMVTFPIACYSTARFELHPGQGVTVTPHYKLKSRQLAVRLLQTVGYTGGGSLVLTSDLPVGKGLASSSADLVATARAVGDAFGMTLDERVIESLLREIEPSDGVMYPGIVVFYHREVRLRERLGLLPRLSIVAHDEGGIVDTVRFNRRVKPFTEADKREYQSLLDTLTTAVRGGDLAAVGAVATRSACLNTKVLPRRDLDRMGRICREVGGLGLMATHSGTQLGVLLADEAGVAHALRLCRQLPGSVSVYRSLGSEHPVGDWNTATR
jgi:uncharacterized protein involved in propanediol utilization